MFKLPEKINNDLNKYKDSLNELEKKRISPDRFKGIRVPWGIYSHRGGKVFMTRIRVPAGLITAGQLKALAFVSEKYGNGELHITTRQDIQIHNVKIIDTIKVMEYLKGFDLSPRGGGGNTVRNVISCVHAGVCPDELFDVSGYASSVTEYLLGQDDSFNLPRKFKVSFSGCQKDCAGCMINDVGLVAKIENGKKGFKVFVGGGMGSNPMIGRLLEDFIPESGIGYCIEGVKRVFYKKGNRRNKHHNRLRFLIGDLGFGEFKKLYNEEIKGLKENEHIALRNVSPSDKAEDAGKIAESEDKGYNELLKYSIHPQKQGGFSSVDLRIPRGDISSNKLTQLASIEKDFPGIEFRVSQNQNLVIVWVKNKDLNKLFSELKKILKNFLYPNTILDVVACKGALTCNLGLCNSPGLAKEMEKVIEKYFIGKDIFKSMEIKLNGCPNACGHHPIGKISFHGMVRKVDNRPVPFYRFFIGGKKHGEDACLAEEAGIVPAKNAHLFLKDFLDLAETKIGKSRDIYNFLLNEAKGIAGEIAEKYQYVPAYSENKDFYIDWGKSEEFSLAGLGAGECGSGVLDMIDADLSDAGVALGTAEKRDYSYEQVKKALFYSARALLVVKGAEPKTDKEAFTQFKKIFLGQGIVSSDYSDIDDVFEKIKDGLNLEERKEIFVYVKGFLEHIKQVYKGMDSSLNFPKAEPAPSRKEARKPAAASILDLKGTPCPINYVKAKLYLENLDSGELVEIVLDEGEPIENVPKSLENDGHKIIEIKKQDNFYKILVKKQ